MHTGTAHLTQGGSSNGFLPQSTEEREKMDQEQALHFFFFFLKKKKAEARQEVLFHCVFISPAVKCLLEANSLLSLPV